MGIINQPVIREYEDSDINQLIEIAKTLPEWFTKNGIEKMKIDLRFQKGYVAVNYSQIVGFLSFFTVEGEGQISWMGVLPQFHRKGIGRMLVAHLTAELKKAGVKTIRVHTLGDSVDYDPYEKTRAFYRGVGFEDFQRLKQDNPECPEKLILKKNI